MSDCCSINPPAALPSVKARIEKLAICPLCGEKGKRVKSITLQSLLKPEALARFDRSVHRFCSNPACDAVYFSGQEAAPFLKSDLTVRVGIKEDTAPRHVCYCFNHTIEEIEEQWRSSGKITVLEDIKTRMKIACWCETKSPQGSCCLATVTKCMQAVIANQSRATNNLLQALSAQPSSDP
jgi:Zinc binding domain